MNNYVYTLNLNNGIYSKDMIIKTYNIEGEIYYKLTGHPKELIREDAVFYKLKDVKDFCNNHNIYMRTLQEDFIINSLEKYYYNLAKMLDDTKN